MIRLWVVAEPPRIRSWGALGLAYLDALGSAGFPLRAISLAGGADLIGPPWGSRRHHFQAPMGDFDVNIVCGHPAFLERLWTVGMRNIAVVGGGRTTMAALDQAREPLQKYDEIWVADWTLFDYYFPNTIYVPPWAAVSHLKGLDG